MNICIIPARGGSQRIPNKNIKEFHGKPIISYSIEVARESGLFDKIVVSTDSHEIAKVATDYGAEVRWRSEELSADEVGTQEVARDVLSADYGSYRKACVIYPCSPLLTADDLKSANIFLDFHHYIFSVGAAPSLHDAGNFYLGWAGKFLSREPLISNYTAIFPLPRERVCDINTPEDWSRAEKMYGELHGIS